MESTHVVTDPRVLRALAHPVRIDLLEQLATHAPLTATRAAGLVGESAASCSFHLRQLAQYGFVEPAPGGQGRERPWRLVGRGLTWSSTGSADERAELMAAGNEVTSILLERAAVAAMCWLSSKNDDEEPWRDVGEVVTAVRRLSADQLHELVARVQEVVEPFLAVSHGKEPEPGTRNVRLAFVAVPDERAP